MIEEFELNDIVWAKIKGYPYWPARITEITDNGKARLCFFGDQTHAYLPLRSLEDFTKSFDKYSNTTNLKKIEAINQARALDLPPKIYSIAKKIIPVKKSITKSSSSNKSSIVKDQIINEQFLQIKSNLKEDNKQLGIMEDFSKLKFTFEEEDDNNNEDNSDSNDSQVEINKEISQLSLFDLLSNPKYLKEFLLYLECICEEIRKGEWNGLNVNEKEVLMRIFWILAQYQFEDLEFIKKSNINMYVSYIENSVHDNDISQSAKAVMNNLTVQYMKGIRSFINIK